MAFVSSTIPQEEENKLAPTGTTTPSPMSMLPPQTAQTGGSAGQGGGASSSNAPSMGSPTKFGSTASRLGDYLKANQDQVQNMASQIAGNLGNQYQSLQQGINQAGTNFGNQVNSGYTPLDQNLLSQVEQNPTQTASNQQNVSEFQNMLNDQYKGPTNFEGSSDYSNLQNQIQNAVQNSGLLNNYSGLSTYLQNNVEHNATPGENTLDTILLQGSQPAMQTVQGAAAPFANLPGELSTTAQTQDQAIQAAQQNAQAAQQQAQNILQNEVQGYQINLQNEGQNYQNEVNAYNQALNGYLQNVPAWLNMPNMNTFNQEGIGSIATPEEYQLQQALNTLSGNPGLLTQLNQNQANLAGTAPQVPNFNQQIPGLWNQIVQNAEQNGFTGLPNLGQAGPIAFGEKPGPGGLPTQQEQQEGTQLYNLLSYLDQVYANGQGGG